MKVALIGANGQLGSDLQRMLNSVEVIALTHAEIEINNMNSVRQALIKHQPDVIINTAAFHRVDDCEIEPSIAFKVNTMGARNVAVVAQEIDAKLVHLSTDYVFGGESESRNVPYTEFDTPIPLNIYGKSKLAGEKLIQHLCTKYFIVRGSGLFGIAGSSGKGGNFVENMLRRGKEEGELRVVDDLIFSPTYTRDLASKITQLISTDYYGIFHITNSNTCSWYEFTREIFKLVGFEPKIIPVTSDQFPQQAKRPHYSVLHNLHLELVGMYDMISWQEALGDYLRAKGHT